MAESDSSVQVAEADEIQDLTDRLRSARTSMSKRDRDRLRKELKTPPLAGDSSGSELSTANGSETGSETDTSRKKRKRTKSKSKNTNPGRLSRLLQRYEGALKGLGDRVVDTNDVNDQELSTLLNALSKEGINRAIQHERRMNRNDVVASTCQMIIPPKLKDTPAPQKAYRDTIATLRDIQRSQITGENTDGIQDFLRTTSRLAESAKLDKDQYLDLLKSRIVQDTSLYKEISNAQKRNLPLKELFEILCLTYNGSNNYLQALKSFNTFTGTNLNAAQFIAKLRTLAHDLVANEPNGRNADADMQTVYQKVKDKVFTVLPSVAPSILEKMALSQDSDQDPLTLFTRLFMHHSEKITQLLSKQRKINQIEELFPVPVQYQEQMQKSRIEDAEQSGDSFMVNQVMTLQKNDIERLRGKCYKCASESPIQKEPHMAKDCLLYKGEPLSMYVCSLCNLGVHLPRVCRQSPAGADRLREQKKKLGLSVEEDTKN